MTDPAELRQVVEALSRGRRFLVTAHPSPDGDAVGSMAAALVALQGMGREVVAYNPDPVPRCFQFLAGTDQFRRELPGTPLDTTLILDCSDPGLLAGTPLLQMDLGTVVVVDHHKTSGDLGEIRLLDPEAASVGVLLYKIFSEMGLDLAPMAEALYCSLLSDTGSFRYQNTSPEAMRVAAHLLELGVDPWRVASGIYEDRPRCQVELLALVLQTLRLSADGRCAALVVTRQMLEDSGCTPDMTDGLINYARGIEGVQVAVLLRPGRDGQVRVSLRSRGQVDVSAVAQQFGGGGHHNAAGCRLRSGPDQAREQVFKVVSQLLAGQH